MKRVLVAWAMVLLAAARAVGADAVSDGLAAWHKGDRAVAREYWQVAAQRGDADAMLLLSQAYNQAPADAADRATARHWLTAAAKAGHPMACYNLGAYYLNGQGVTEDPQAAAHWWRRAAVQGLPQAQYNLGSLYLRGLGVPRDRAQARWWFEQAAAQGSARANKALQAMARSQAPAMADPGSDIQSTTAAPDRTAGFDPVAGERWLREQPDNAYVLQIFASPDAAAVRSLLARHAFEDRVAVYRFQRAGIRWFGVVLGSYADVERARATAAKLPAELRNGSPWVRSLRELITILPQKQAGMADG